MRAGDFSEWLAFGPSRQIHDPNNVIPNPDGSGFIRAPFPGNIIPSDRLSKVSQHYQGFFPLPNQPDLVNNWRGTLVAGFTNNYKYSAKVDHNLDDGRQRLSLAFDHSRTTQLSPGNWSGPLATGLNFRNFAFRVRANWQVTFGSNKVFSFRTAINRTLTETTWEL